MEAETTNMYFRRAILEQYPWGGGGSEANRDTPSAGPKALKGLVSKAVLLLKFMVSPCISKAFL